MPPRSRQSWPLGTRLTPSDLQAERPSAVCREDALERRELQESVSGGFTWAIDNFSKCRAEVLRSAPGCEVGGYRWCAMRPERALAAQHCTHANPNVVFIFPECVR